MFIQVVAAVIRDSADRILIAKRKKHTHQGGLWEFPGGKVESGERPFEALKREISEELGVLVCNARPLIKVHHRYVDKSVCLDVWEVTEFRGEAFGREGQAIEWVSLDVLNAIDKSREYEFPAANAPILKAIQLPRIYCITPDIPFAKPSAHALSQFVAGLEQTLDAGCKMLQLRAPSLQVESYLALAQEVLPLCRDFTAKLILHGDLSVLDRVDADGIHLSGRQLRALSERPISERLIIAGKTLGASCHCPEELEKAQLLQCNYASLSPVRQTVSHPNRQTLGWKSFNAMVNNVNLPVYALGGLSPDDLREACMNGAQGVSGISAFWRGESFGRWQ